MLENSMTFLRGILSAGRNILEVTHMQEIRDKDNEYILVLYSTLGPKDYLFYIILFISVFAFFIYVA